MTDKTKILGAFVIGAIAGIAIKKLLESEKGEELIESAKEKVEKTANDFEAKLELLQKQINDLLTNNATPKV